MSRINREKNTIRAMVQIYCRHHHKSKKILCDECSKLEAYAFTKLSKCNFGSEKPVCNKCTIHCYHKDYREKIKQVMRFSGPKMLIKNPILAIWHFIDARHLPKSKNK